MRGRADAAYLTASEAIRLTRRHYENFPVLSVFVPRELRLSLGAVYAFARVTDDLGDEGGASPEERLATLERWQEELDTALEGRPSSQELDPVLVGLARTIRAHDLPVECFRALIHANRLDQLRSRYSTYAELLEYCRYSANPVGRIVLRLFGSHDPALHARSDAICTALQLANHLQGIGDDLRLRDRLYVPLEDLERFGVREADLRAGRPSRSVRMLVGHLIDRTRALLETGASLPAAFEGRRAAVLRLFVRGGRAILSEVARRQDDLLRARIRVARGRRFLLVATEGVRLLATEGARWLRD